MTTRAELAAVEPSEAQRRSKVYQHVDSGALHTLLRAKEPAWVAAWLRERYPTTDKQGLEHENATENARMQLSERTLTRYRDEYMPEAAGGISGYVVNSEIEDLIGHRLPAPLGSVWETQVLETTIHIAQANMARALRSDEEMDMLNPITLEAQKVLVETLARSIDLKSRLGIAGYEAAPEQQHIVTENSHVSVELRGRVNPKTGEVSAVDADRLDLARKLMDATPEERAALIAAVQAAPAAPLDAEITDAEEIVIVQDTPDGD